MRWRFWKRTQPDPLAALERQLTAERHAQAYRDTWITELRRAPRAHE